MQRSITISMQKLVCLLIKLLVVLVLSIMKCFSNKILFYPSVIHFYVMCACSCVDMHACMSLSFGGQSVTSSDVLSNSLSYSFRVLLVDQGIILLV